MTPDEAQALAERLYEGRLDRVGIPEVEHLRAVADGVSGDDAKVVAWLHDALEDELIDLAGISRHRTVSWKQASALLLLNRSWLQSGTYSEYVRRLARAEGDAGDLARRVKLADLAHNMRRPCPPEMLAMRQPGGRYWEARRVLREAMGLCDRCGLRPPERRGYCESCFEIVESERES